MNQSINELAYFERLMVRSYSITIYGDLLRLRSPAFWVDGQSSIFSTSIRTSLVSRRVPARGGAPVFHHLVQDEERQAPTTHALAGRQG